VARWLVGLTLLWACLAGCYQHIPSPDLWWLLADGRLISDTGSIPSSDPFSWTAQGAPWHNDQWLAGWLAFQVYRLTGLEGLHLVKTLLLTFSFGLLLDTGRRLRKDSQFGWLVPALAITLASADGAHFFDVRAYLFTYLGLAILWRWLQLRDRLQPVAVFLLFAAWGNLHGGVSSGLLLLGLECLAQRRAHLLKMTLLALLAACCNPSGIWLLLHPLRLLGSPWGLYLNEWAPLWRRPDKFTPLLINLSAWLVWAAVARPRWRKADGVMLLFGLFSLTGWRHIPLFALLALPRWCLHLKGPQWCWQATCAGLLLWAGLKPLAVADPSQSMEQELFPARACGVIAEVGEKPVRLFHPYGLGGYLLWRGFPVCIDGRAVQVYPWETYKTYLLVALPKQSEGEDLNPARQRFDQYCRDNGVEAALLFTDPRQKEAGLWLVQGNERWRPVYSDDLVTLVVTGEGRWYRR
jgi:hypothetical protein